MFHSLKKTSYIPEKDATTGKYNFRETNWTKGVITDDIVNESSRLITRASNKTFTDLSLIKTEDDNWGKRKILHLIKVNIEKNTEAMYDDAISFLLVQVKRSMFTNSIPGSSVSNQANWSLNQLINTPQKICLILRLNLTILCMIYLVMKILL